MSIAEAFYNTEDEIINNRKELKEKFINTPEMTIGDYRTVSQLYPITFEGYQQGTKWTAQYPKSIPNELYLALGLAGECGEVIEICKKIFRDNDGLVSEEWKDRITKEAGDVLYYLAALCLSFGISLESVAKENQIKLVDRLKRNVVGGSGDNR